MSIATTAPVAAVSAADRSLPTPVETFLHDRRWSIDTVLRRYPTRGVVKVRDADGMPVVVKFDFGRPAAIAREYRMTRALATRRFRALRVPEVRDHLDGVIATSFLDAPFLELDDVTASPWEPSRIDTFCRAMLELHETAIPDTDRWKERRGRRHQLLIRGVRQLGRWRRRWHRHLQRQFLRTVVRGEIALLRLGTLRGTGHGDLSPYNVSLPVAGRHLALVDLETLAADDFAPAGILFFCCCPPARFRDWRTQTELIGAYLRRLATDDGRRLPPTPLARALRAFLLVFFAERLAFFTDAYAVPERQTIFRAAIDDVLDAAVWESWTAQVLPPRSTAA